MNQHARKYIETRRPFDWRRLPGLTAGGHRGLLAKLGDWRKRRRTIRDLEAMDDRMLADVGLSRDQIRPFVDDLLQAGPAKPCAANDNSAVIAA